MLRDLTLLKKAIDINPRNGLAYMVLARYSIIIKDHAMASYNYQKARSFNPS